MINAIPSASDIVRVIFFLFLLLSGEADPEYIHSGSKLQKRQNARVARIPSQKEFRGQSRFCRSGI